MPIRPENQKLYPGGGTGSKEWAAIRAAILKRADDCCELCGVPNHEVIERWGQGLWDWMSAEWGVNGTYIVLTIAHLDHDPRNSDPSNLKALCQRCHNRHDAKDRAKNRRARLERESGQLRIEGT